MKYKFNRRQNKMHKTLLVVAGLLAGLVIGITATTRAVTSDTDLLAGIKNLFLQAGWTPPGAPPVDPPTNGKPSDITGPLWTVIGPFNKVGATDSPENLYVTKAQTDSRYAPYMFMRDGAVVFKTPVNGVTTANSEYSRTELREMKNLDWGQASWSSSSGTHTMIVAEAITHQPVAKPDVVAAQIHGSSDDLIQIRLEGAKLYVEYNDGNSLGTLNPSYVLGTKYTVKIVAGGGRIKVYYDDVLKVDWGKSTSGLYFKAGSYCNSNLGKGDSASAYCEVVIYSLSVSHT